MNLTEEKFSTKIEVAGLVFFLACYAILSAFLEYRRYPVHRGAVAVLIGVISGLVIRLSSPETYHEITRMDETIIFLVLLPSILFAKGYTFKKGAFIKNMNYIALFGVLGTFLSFIVISFLVYGANQLINSFTILVDLVRDSKDINNFRNLSIWEIILLSACLCSIDTVASEEAIEENKFSKLNAIVVGQDIFKDCVTIVLFRAILKLQNMETPNKFQFFWYTPFEILINFGYLIAGSLILSTLLALATSYMFKRLRFLQNDNGVSQTTTLFLLGFTTYILAECFNLSGIISILCYGVILNKYNIFNLSETGQSASKNTFLFVSNISEGLMFLIMGIMVWEIQWTQQSHESGISHSYVFSAIVVLILVIGRLVNVYFLWFVTKILQPKLKLNWSELFIIFISGLARGATPFALFTSVQFLDSTSTYAKNEGLVLKTTIIIVVLLCTVILNSLIPTIYKKHLKKLQGQAKQYLLYKSHEDPKQHKLKRLAKSHFRKFQEQKLKPLLIYNYEERKEQIDQIKQSMKRESFLQALRAIQESEHHEQGDKHKQSLLQE